MKMRLGIKLLAVEIEDDLIEDFDRRVEERSWGQVKDLLGAGAGQ